MKGMAVVCERGNMIKWIWVLIIVIENYTGVLGLVVLLSCKYGEQFAGIYKPHRRECYLRGSQKVRTWIDL